MPGQLWEEVSPLPGALLPEAAVCLLSGVGTSGLSQVCYYREERQLEERKDLLFRVTGAAICVSCLPGPLFPSARISSFFLSSSQRASCSQLSHLGRKLPRLREDPEAWHSLTGFCCPLLARSSSSHHAFSSLLPLPPGHLELAAREPFPGPAPLGFL